MTTSAQPSQPAASSDHPQPQHRALAPGQHAQVWVADAVTGRVDLVHDSSTVLLEAPNWSDDDHLLLNGDGHLWSLPLNGPHRALRKIRFTGLPEINNDHVLQPGTDVVLMTANDGHIYAGSQRGGAVHRTTPVDGQHHFLHGLSPDGDWLAYVEIPLADTTQPGRVVQRSRAGAPPRRLDAGGRHCDGPEYSPDGEWVYLNTEAFSTTPGHAQLARFPATGGPLEQLLSSTTVDWFPHLAPRGDLATYVAFPAGTLGHPADVDVEVRVVDTSDWGTPLHVFPVPGGQGTLNVNSWSPDGLRFAFVSYPTP